MRGVSMVHILQGVEATVRGEDVVAAEPLGHAERGVAASGDQSG